MTPGFFLNVNIIHDTAFHTGGKPYTTLNFMMNRKKHCMRHNAFHNLTVGAGFDFAKTNYDIEDILSLASYSLKHQHVGIVPR